MLSYKNHALDEFLIDIIKSTNTNTRLNQPGGLIRTGKPDIEALLKFTEKFSPIEKAAQEELSHRLTVQRRARSIAKSWIECARALESGITSQVIHLMRYIYTYVCLNFFISMMLLVRCHRMLLTIIISN